MKPEIRDRFKEVAAYDEAMPRIFAGYDALRRVALSHLRTKLGERARLLDVGCGTGTTLLTFAAHQPEWSMVGVDPAPPMVELARAKADDAGVADRVTLTIGTIDAVPEDARFDAATILLVEHLLPDDGTKLETLEQTARRLEPGGWLVLAGLHGDFATPTTQLALAAWSQSLEVEGFPEPLRASFHHRATVEDSLVPESRIRELLAQAGFVDVERIFQVMLLGGWLARRA